MSTTLFTVIFGGLLSALTTYFLNVRKEHVFLMRKHAEELYHAALHLDNQAIERIVLGEMLANGRLSREDYMDGVFNMRRKSNNNAILFLTKFYFPHLKDPTFDVQDAIYDLNFAAEDRSANVAGDTTDLSDKISHRVAEVTKARKHLMGLVDAECARYAGFRGFAPELWMFFSAIETVTGPRAAKLD